MSEPKDLKSHALTATGTMLLTGLISWFTFGQNVLTVTDHKEPEAHMQQKMWNEKTEMRIDDLEEFAKNLPNDIAKKVLAGMRENGER